MRFTWTALGVMVPAVVLVAGCAAAGIDATDAAGGPRELPDGFLSISCESASDCDDANACTMDTCGPSKVCAYATKSCGARADQCNTGECDPLDGACFAKSIEGKACTTADSMPGVCILGMCTMGRECRHHPTPLVCGAKVTGSVLSASPLSTDGYACATGLTGNEYAYELMVKTDRMVTLSLSGTSADTDLVVLQGTRCAGDPACAASASTSAGDETLSFAATGKQSYLVVVDSKNGAASNYTLDVGCQGGVCMPLGTLACNQSIAGDTSLATATNWVGATGCGQSAPGPEQTYRLAPMAGAQVRAKLKGLSQDLDLAVLRESAGECDPALCVASSAKSGTQDEELAFTGPSTSTIYDLVVDSKAAGGPYLLEVSCPPSCSSTVYILCPESQRAQKNNGPNSKNVVTTWGSCAPNETGPEVVYSFAPRVTGSYTFELTGLSADLDLIVIAGTASTCDASSACVASSVQTGTTSESVTFVADAAVNYWIAVDGKNGAVGDFILTLKSDLCAPYCNSTSAIDCEVNKKQFTGSNGDPVKSLDKVDSWPCDADTTGPEVVYWLDPVSKGHQYTITLDQLTADLDLIVRKSGGYSCTLQAACLASSVNSGTTPESVTFTVTDNATYWVAVDGKNGAVGNYRIKISSPTVAGCPP